MKEFQIQRIIFHFDNGTIILKVGRKKIRLSNMHAGIEGAKRSAKFNVKRLITLMGRSRSKSDRIDWGTKKKRADILATIDFGCDFIDGTCQHYRRTDHPQCCCVGCANSHGYLDRDYQCFHPDETQTYLDNYHGLLGFWRPKIGCTLPRWLRSVTCQVHNCLPYNDDPKRHIERETIRFLGSLPIIDKAIPLSNYLKYKATHTFDGIKYKIIKIEKGIAKCITWEGKRVDIDIKGMIVPETIQWRR